MYNWDEPEQAQQLWLLREIAVPMYVYIHVHVCVYVCMYPRYVVHILYSCTYIRTYVHSIAHAYAPALALFMLMIISFPKWSSTRLAIIDCALYVQVKMSFRVSRLKQFETME